MSQKFQPKTSIRLRNTSPTNTTTDTLTCTHAYTHVHTKPHTHVNRYKNTNAKKKKHHQTKGSHITDDEIRGAEDKFAESLHLAQLGMYNLLENDVSIRLGVDVHAVSSAGWKEGGGAKLSRDRKVMANNKIARGFRHISSSNSILMFSSFFVLFFRQKINKMKKKKNCRKGRASVTIGHIFRRTLGLSSTMC